MINTFTLDQLVALVRRWALIDGDRTDASVLRTDGIDIDELLKFWIRRWYADVLANAPVNLLPATQVDAQTKTSMRTPWMARIVLPDNFCRLASFRLASWQMPAEILSLDNPAHLYRWRRQASVYARATPNAPLVFVDPIEKALFVSPVAQNDKIESCTVVLDPGPDGPFAFSPSLFNSLSSYVKYLDITCA